MSVAEPGSTLSRGWGRLHPSRVRPDVPKVVVDPGHLPLPLRDRSVSSIGRIEAPMGRWVWAGLMARDGVHEEGP